MGDPFKDPKIADRPRDRRKGTVRQESFPVDWGAKHVRLLMEWRNPIQQGCHHTHLKEERDAQT